MAIDSVVGRSSRAARAGRAVPAAVLVVFFLWPVAHMVASHLDPSAIGGVLSDASMRRVAWFTLWQAALSTAVSLAIGLPLTWALSRWRFRGSALLAGLVGAAFLVPSAVMAAGLAAILPSRGIPAIIWAHVSFNVAVVLRVVGPTWSMVETTQEESAASLGAGPASVFRDATWPAISGAVRNAAALIFTFCFSSFATVSILGGPTIRTIETEVFTQAFRLGDVPSAVALSVIQALVVGAVLLVGRGGAPVESTDVPGRRPLTARQKWMLAPAVIATAGTLVVASPLAAVVLRSARSKGRWTAEGWRALFDGTLSPVGVDVPSVLRTSLGFAIATAAITVPLALLSCGRARPGLIERISIVPLLTSPVTLGLGLITTFNSAPHDWRGRMWLVPVIHSVIALPLAVRVLGPATRSIGAELLEAAADLGASRSRAWWTVQVPLARPALLRAAGISAAVSIGEFGATSFLSRAGTMTLPIAIGQLLGRPGETLQLAAFALATLALLVTTAVLSRV